MADAPPWPNFSTLLRYHIIWYLLRLSALSSVFSDHPHCRCICLYISRLHHLKVWKHYPPPRKKKVRPRLPSSLATLRGNHFERGGAAPPIPRLTVFAVAVVWFYYVMSCQVEMCFHRAVHMMTERSRALRRYQAWDSQVNARPNTSSIHFVFDFCPIGVDGNASCCMGNHPDQFEDLQLITDGKSVSGIGSEVIIKGLCMARLEAIHCRRSRNRNNHRSKSVHDTPGDKQQAMPKKYERSSSEPSPNVSANVHIQTRPPCNPLQHFLLTVPQRFPPTNTTVEMHEYFSKWKAFDEDAFDGFSGDELVELLRKGVYSAVLHLL